MTQDQDIAELKKQVELLTKHVDTLNDTNEIRHLQHQYGYYLDKCLYDEVVDLFAEESTVHFLNGLYHGKEGARRLMCGWFREFFTGGHNGPVYGFLLDHLQLQDIVTVAPDGKSAKGRFRCLMQGGVHKTREKIEGFPTALWEAGVYENTYVKENGVWKIGIYNYSMLWQADYSEGWDNGSCSLMPLEKTFPEDPNGPDELLPMAEAVWPNTRVVPFHYDHPITGKKWQGDVNGIAVPLKK